MPTRDHNRGRRKRLSILLLADDRPEHANTLLDHISSFKAYSRHRVHVFNPVGIERSRVLRLDGYDVVLIHYSLLITSDQYVAPAFKELIRRFGGLKVQFIQDEYRTIDAITSAMRDLGIDVIFTMAAEAEARRLYEERVPGAETFTTLAGYVPERLVHRVAQPLASRPIEVGYRGRVIPFWLGDLSQDKVRIATGFAERAKAYGLRCDIGWREEDRIYGAAWDEFLASCRCTLGTESGASIADWDGSIEQRVNAFLAERPDATFEDVSSAILACHEGNLRIPAISPRAFEAIALRSALVQFPGSYSGVLKPWEHYIPLEKDFSNFDDVVVSIRDCDALEAMVDRAYADVVASGAYSFRQFIREFDDVVEARATKSGSGVVWTTHLRQLERRARLEIHLPRVVVRKPVISRLRGELRRIARAIVLVRALIRQSELRRLLVLVARTPEFREQERLRAVMAELFRFAVLATACQRPEVVGFRATVHLDSDGTLRFTSRAIDDVTQGSTVNAAALAKAFNERSIRRIVWSHAAVGNSFTYPLMLGKRLSFYVRADHQSSREFEELLRLAQHAPETAGRAVAAPARAAHA